MKLHQILGRILTDVALRQKYPEMGVCNLFDMAVDRYPTAMRERLGWQFGEAREACRQTPSSAYCVAAPENGSREDAGMWYSLAQQNNTMWRGQYGLNRRRFLRDCWHWAKERDV